MKKVILFDLHDTLTEGTQPISDSIAKFLNDLSKRYVIGITSGVTMDHFEKQIIPKVEDISKWLFYPMMGANDTLTNSEKQRIINVLWLYPGFDVLDRDTHIAFTPYGLSLEQKKVWDPDKSKRKTLIDSFGLNEFDAKCGGHTTILIGRKGVNKTQCVKRLAESGYTAKEIVYVGNAFENDGDDKCMEGVVDCIKVRNPLETPDKVYDWLENNNRIVAIAGYFDPINEGHLTHIEQARCLGDYLIAFAGTEEQCDRKPSHNGRHFHSWPGKVAMLKKLGCDEVVPSILDEHGSCAPSILKYKPHIFAKGDLETDEPVPQAEVDACAKINCQIIYGIGKRLNHSSKYFQE